MTWSSSTQSWLHLRQTCLEWIRTPFKKTTVSASTNEGAVLGRPNCVATWKKTQLISSRSAIKSVHITLKALNVRLYLPCLYHLGMTQCPKAQTGTTWTLTVMPLMRQQIRKVVGKDRHSGFLWICAIVWRSRARHAYSVPIQGSFSYTIACTQWQSRAIPPHTRSYSTRSPRLGSTHEERDKRGVMRAKQATPSHYQLFCTHGKAAGDSSHTSFPPVMD